MIFHGQTKTVFHKPIFVLEQEKYKVFLKNTKKKILEKKIFFMNFLILKND